MFDQLEQVLEKFSLFELCRRLYAYNRRIIGSKEGLGAPCDQKPLLDRARNVLRQDPERANFLKFFEIFNSIIP